MGVTLGTMFAMMRGCYRHVSLGAPPFSSSVFAGSAGRPCVQIDGKEPPRLHRSAGLGEKRKRANLGELSTNLNGQSLLFWQL